MSQRRRILIAVLVVLVLLGLVAAVDLLRRAARPASVPGEPTVAAGSVPIRLDGRLVGSFAPADLQRLNRVGFTDAEEAKPQDGWLLRDVILLYVSPGDLAPASTVTVSSSSRNKSAHLTWAEVQQAENSVMFDLSNRGTLKLVSLLPKLDTRDEWVQDVDSIEIDSP